MLGDAFSNDRYFSTIFEARQQLREGQLAAASQGEAQILPMMARAAAAGDGVDYSQYESLIKEIAPDCWLITRCRLQPVRVAHQGDGAAGGVARRGDLPAGGHWR